MNANSTYRDAIIDDGRQLLYEVTSRLYKGGNLRPDVYFQRDPKLGSKNYNKIFGIFDKTITESGPAENYNIREGARHFDVSVHTAIITQTCGCSSDDPLLLKVMQVKNLRNAVCHTGDTSNIVTEGNLNEKMRELLELYTGIIKDLETETGDNLSDVRMQVASKIMDRIKKHEARNKLSLQPYNTPINPQHTPSRRSTPDSSPAMPTWGKVALGVTTGIAALAVGVAVAGATARESETEKRRRDKAKGNQTRNRNNNNEECTVM